MTWGPKALDQRDDSWWKETKQMWWSSRDDADVGFRPDAAKTLGKDHHLGAGQHLGTQHPRTIAAAHGVHVTLDVGVPDDGADLVHVWRTRNKFFLSFLGTCLALTIDSSHLIKPIWYLKSFSICPWIMIRVFTPQKMISVNRVLGSRKSKKFFAMCCLCVKLL